MFEIVRTTRINELAGALIWVAIPHTGWGSTVTIVGATCSEAYEIYANLILGKMMWDWENLTSKYGWNDLKWLLVRENTGTALPDSRWLHSAVSLQSIHGVWSCHLWEMATGSHPNGGVNIWTGANNPGNPPCATVSNLNFMPSSEAKSSRVVDNVVEGASVRFFFYPSKFTLKVSHVVPISICTNFKIMSSIRNFMGVGLVLLDQSGPAPRSWHWNR